MANKNEKLSSNNYINPIHSPDNKNHLFPIPFDYISAKTREKKKDVSEKSNYQLLVNTMSLWVDKYRPKSLDKLDYHEDISKRLRALVCIFLNQEI